MTTDYQIINEEKLIAEWRAEERVGHGRDIRRGLLLSLKHRCKDDENFTLTRLERWFYIAKAWYCALVGRGWTEKHGQYPDEVEVSTLYSVKTYGGWEAAWFIVGHGLFRNWYVSINRDGDTNL
jgi:hypothetical protein